MSEPPPPSVPVEPLAPTSTEAPAPAPPSVAAPARKRFPWKLVIILTLLAGLATALFIGGHSAFEWVKGVAEKARTPETLTILCIVYAVLLAIPGVPGLEVGLVMMAVFAEVGILAAWLCTIVGLNLAFLGGRKIPRAKLEKWLKPKDVPESELPAFAIGKGDTMTLVFERNKLGRKILKWTGPPGGWRRYLLIGLLFNMPGNFIIGGGGGIGLFCGTSDDIKWRWYLLTTTLAAAVIPLMVYLGLFTAREVLPV